MLPILLLPYVFRRRFYELQSPTCIYYLRNISSQISQESSYIPMAVDRLYLNAFDSFTYIDENQFLCQKIGFSELLQIKCCNVTNELFIDQLSTQQLSAVSGCIFGNYSSLSLTGFPCFEDLKRLLKPNVKNLTFCGKIINLPELKELFKSFKNLTSLM
uniref:Toll-like receptor 4 n=1 Tax=Panagrolaimus davidi TaxID=227884 RepID=A0A914Q826_9BILA